MGRSRRRREQRQELAVKQPAEGQRVDKWMWCVRITKTRSEAARLVAAGAVRLNRVKVEKAAVMVHLGDVLTVVRFGQVKVYRVRGFSARRVGAAAAQQLREEL